MSTATAPVEIQRIESETLSWPEKARMIRIIDQATYDQATNAIKAILDLRAEVKSHHEPVIQAAHKAHKEALAARARYDDPLNEAEKILRSSIGAFHTEQERLRKEQERIAQELQRKQDEEALLAAAVDAENEGEPEVAAVILDQPIAPVRVVAAPTYNRAQGVSTRPNWKAEVTDLKALCRAIADGTASPNLVLPNVAALNSLAKANHENMNVPGVRAVRENVVAVRR